VFLSENVHIPLHKQTMSRGESGRRERERERHASVDIIAKDDLGLYRPKMSSFPR